MIHLRFEVAGDVQLSRALDIAADELEDLSPAFERMAADFYETQRQVFIKEGGFEGLKPWAPLSDSYAAWKERHYPGRPILVLIGRLRAALTVPNARGAIKQVTANSLILGAHVPVKGGWNLAALHQHGTRKMPARPPLRLTEPQKKRWVKYMHEHVWSDAIIRSFERANYRAFRARVEREP